LKLVSQLFDNFLLSNEKQDYSLQRKRQRGGEEGEEGKAKNKLELSFKAAS